MENEITAPNVEPTKTFEPITTKELLEVLGSTVKRDDTNKLITFLCQLAAFTEDSQFNVSFNAPSSSGKSYIPIEITRYFPKEDLIKLGTCSPRAFYHEQGKYDKATNTIRVDLERKILVFLDQPNLALLKELRSLLSHDEKEIHSKITDKAQRGGNMTKNVIIRGFPSVIFCSAWLTIDEQEGTRFILLSPEADQEKLREAIQEKIKRDTDKKAHREWLEKHPGRQLLKERIAAIKSEGITDVKVPSSEKIAEVFLGEGKLLQPRGSRDVGRVIAFIKSLALLNLWSRERDGNVIVANDDDITEALKLWDEISISQEMNLPPYIFNTFREVIVPAWKEKEKTYKQQPEKIGLERNEICKHYLQKYGRALPDWMLRQQIILMLENAGLIEQRQLPNDRRKLLIYPTRLLNLFQENGNSERGGGVEENEQKVVSEDVGEDKLLDHHSTDMTSETR